MAVPVATRICAICGECDCGGECCQPENANPEGACGGSASHVLPRPQFHFRSPAREAKLCPNRRRSAPAETTGADQPLGGDGGPTPPFRLRCCIRATFQASRRG